MRNNEKFGDFWNVLFSEFELSKEMMLELTGYKILMQEEPINRKSIKIREKIVLPLLSIQQYALIKLQKNEGDRDTYEKLVMRSLRKH
jgi:phosphoenolpyruvate carboxylase